MSDNEVGDDTQEDKECEEAIGEGRGGHGLGVMMGHGEAASWWPSGQRVDSTVAYG